MNVIRRTGARFLNDDSGGSLLGYAVLIGIVLVAIYWGAGYQSGGGRWEPPTLLKLPNWWKS